MEHTAHDIVSESLQDELRAIDFYLLAADVAPTRAARVAARRFAREEEQHFDELVEWIEGTDDRELHAVLQKVHLLQYDHGRRTRSLRRWMELCQQEAAADPVRMLFEIALAKERRSLGYHHALERHVHEPAARRALRTLCTVEEHHRRFLEEQYHRLVSDPDERTAVWH